MKNLSKISKHMRKYRLEYTLLGIDLYYLFMILYFK